MKLPTLNWITNVFSHGAPASDLATGEAKTVVANAVDAATPAVNTVKTGFDTEPAARAAAELVPEKMTFLDALENPNFFGELDNNTEFTPSPNANQNADVARQALEGKGSGEKFFSGDVGRMHSARFVNRYHRADGDFRYAYGDVAYRNWAKADAMLRAIPQGQLADALDVDLIKKVGVEAFVEGEEPLMERMGHMLRELEGRGIKPGQLRDYTTQTTPEKVLPADQIANIRALGLKYDELGIENGKGLAVIKYPPPEQMRAELDKLIADTKTALKDPNSDPITIAANFGQKFIALHPLQDLNGRVGRLFMDRILAERGLPPPIIKDTGADYSLSAAAYRSEVAKGVSRMISATRATATRSGYSYMSEALNRSGIRLPPAKDVAPVQIDGLRYALGADGFVYNEAGRAHLVDEKGVLQPLTQFQHYFAARRIFQSNDPKAMLDSLTASTRKAFEEGTATPEALAKMKVGDDKAAMAADNAYQMTHLDGELGNRFARMFDPALSKPEKLFGLDGNNGAGTKTSFAMSRHAQIDHELYLLQHAAMDAGDQTTATLVQAYRETLFNQAKDALKGMKDESRVSPENPNGFRYGYEKIQHDHSLLRFNSFAEAERASGHKMTVFRGDSAAVQYTGVSPDGHFSHKDALEVGKFREERGGTVNFFKDISSVLGASGGTGYQSTTTDLALLAREGGFADKIDNVPLDLDALPGWLRETVKSHLKPGETLSVDSLRDLGMNLLTGRDIPAGHIDISGVEPQLLDDVLAKKLVTLPPEQQAMVRNRIADARREAGEHNFLSRMLAGLSDRQTLVKLDDVFPESGSRITDLQDDVAKLRDYLTIRRNPSDENSLSVRSHRRAFLFDVNRDAGINAPGTLGQGSFHTEQEMTLFNTGLDSTAPWNISGMYTQGELAHEFPAKGEVATAAEKAAAPANQAPTVVETPVAAPAPQSALPSAFSEGTAAGAPNSTVSWN